METKQRTRAAEHFPAREPTGGFYLQKAIHEKIDTELQELFRLKMKIRNRGYIA